MHFKYELKNKASTAQLRTEMCFYELFTNYPLEFEKL